MLNRTEAIAYLQQYLTGNKARGMVAELNVEAELGIAGTPLAHKLLTGGWIVSPKGYPYHRFCVFVLPTLFAAAPDATTAINELEHNRDWQSLATFLSRSHIGIIVTAGISIQGGVFAPNDILWRNYIYVGERLLSTKDDRPFSTWPGNRGRANKVSEKSAWTPDVVARFEQSTATALEALTVRQAFYYSYLKTTLKKPLDDPYDVDAFIVGYQGRVLPVEIKEKSQTKDGKFGVDAGRILMLLRLCLLTDNNALYLIREVDDTPKRKLIKWRYITLADLVTKCSWNLQGGGRGMGGGATQTIMMSSTAFNHFSAENLKETWLAAHGSLQAGVKQALVEISQGLNDLLTGR